MKKTQLRDKFELYLPTKARDREVEDLLAKLTDSARGMTAASVQGGYVANDLRVITEGVVIYTFYAPHSGRVDRIEELVEELVDYLLYYKTQESVLLVHNGVPYLYEREA